MNKTYTSLLKACGLILLVFGTFGCGGSSSSTKAPAAPTLPNTPPAQAANIMQFGFYQTANPSLSANVILEIEGTNIVGRVPDNINVNTLVASFFHTGSEVKVNNLIQTSGQTANDFTQKQQYTVTSSDGSSRQYTVDLTRFTGLPVVYLNTDGNVSITSKDDYINGQILITGTRDYLSLPAVDMEIRGRGNSTWQHPKKPYQMKLTDKSEILGMPSDKKWLFIAEYSDKTMLRNKIAFELGYMSKLSWTPKSEFAEVYLNDDYIGTYHITEKVEEGDSRVVLADVGYLLEIDQLERLDSDDVYFNTARFLINIKEPEVNWASAELAEVSAIINEFESALFASNFKDQTSGYSAYIDLDSFIDWYLISEITKNVDSRSWSSIYLNVIPGKKIKMGPLWDFDLSFGNVDYADSQYPEGFWIKEHQWYQRLFQDPAFVTKVQERFVFFKENQATIIGMIDEYANRLKWAQQENDNRWQTLGIYVWPNPVVFDTHQQEVDYLKNWLNVRMQWLEEALNAL
ncbi:CotH kinase family protein [Glaciecola sp. SC05]|uniref:CotH kinase family protein n=1 Tax=Glaciecola sp. SC05 TaxID=1987355 RepID=UPI0035297C20